ncbi:MAG: helix-turn-helix domain-containing protein [Rhizobiaceae bacterium]
MSTLLSTNSVGKHERFAYWREAVCDSYVLLDCECNDPERFDGEIILNRMSRMSTSFVGGSSQTVRRRKRDISRSNDESFLISMQLNKDGIVQQSDRQAHLKPGDFALYSSIDRYRLELPNGFRQLVVQVPRNDLLSRLPNADLITGVCVSGESIIGSVVNDSVLRLVSAMEQANEAVTECAQESIIDLFVTGFASIDQSKYHLSNPEHQILMRANAVIRSNLHDPEFGRTALAAAMGMSVRRLSEIYQRDGKSISSTIRQMRLNKIATDLRDGRLSRHSISEIARKWGMENQPSLVRNFKSKFGVTPSEYRTGIVAG